MDPAMIHSRGQAAVPAVLPHVPARGDYIEHDAQLWIVDAIVIGTTVDVYASQVSTQLADSLRKQWATWHEPTDGLEG